MQTAVQRWRERNPERNRMHGRKATAAWRARNPDKDAEYRKVNAESLQAKATVRLRKRRLVDPALRVKENLSRRINKALAGIK